MIRPLMDSDSELLFRWRNQDEIRDVMLSDALIQPEEHTLWFQRMRAAETPAVFIFEWQGKPCGMVQFTQYDKVHNRAYWGFYLGERDVPRGTGTLLGYLGLRYIFEEVGVRKLCAEVISHNNRSLRFHEKLGFCQEGLLKRHVMKKGIYHDLIAYAMFSDEWTTHRSGIENLISVT